MLLESNTYARPVGGRQIFISGNIGPKSKRLFLFAKRAFNISVFDFAFIGARKASVDICNYGVSQISICYQLAKLECFSRLQSALSISVFNFAFVGAQKTSVDIAATIYYT